MFCLTVTLLAQDDEKLLISTRNNWKTLYWSFRYRKMGVSGFLQITLLKILMTVLIVISQPTRFYNFNVVKCFLNLPEQGCIVNKLLGTNLSRYHRDSTKCVLDNKLGCQKRQKWYCRMANGKMRKFRCKEEKGLLPHVKNKQCVCFTPEGPIFETYLVLLYINNYDIR